MRSFLFSTLIFLNGLIGQTKSELQILNRLIDSSLIPIQDFFVKESVNFLSFNIISESELIESIIRAKILSLTSENSSSEKKLEVIVNKFGIAYPFIASYPLFGEEKVRREISLNISYTLIEGDKVIFNSKFDNVYTDTVSISDIKFDLTDKTKSNGTIPQVPIWRSLIEPAIISSLTGLIIYLFFNVRSK